LNFTSIVRRAGKELTTETLLSPALFHGRHFAPAIIILCVRWYLIYKLSYRDLVEMMAGRGVNVSHTTILRWVQRFVPEFEKKLKLALLQRNL
jgi:transposase-like protein